MQGNIGLYCPALAFDLPTQSVTYKYISCIHTYIHTYIHTHIHTYTHTHIHTYTHTCYVTLSLPIVTNTGRLNTTSHKYLSQLLVRLLVQITNALYVRTVDEHCPNILPTILSLYFVYVTSYLNVTMHCGFRVYNKIICIPMGSCTTFHWKL